MARLTATDFMEKAKLIIGDRTDDDALSFLEDCKDTISDDKGGDDDWKTKYETAVKEKEQLDKDWRNRYRDTFFSPASHTDNTTDTNPANNAHVEDNNEPDLEAEAKKVANEAQVNADTDIADKQNQLRIRQAELKKESDIKQAEADAAYEIQKEEQRKTIEITTANANIAAQEKAVELKKKEAEVKDILDWARNEVEKDE